MSATYRSRMPAVDLAQGLDESRVAGFAATRSRAWPRARWPGARSRPRPRPARRSRRIPRRRTGGVAARTSLLSAAGSTASAHPMVSNSSMEKPIRAAWAAMSVAVSIATAVEAPPVGRPQVRQLALHPVDLLRHSGPFQRFHRRTASSAKYDACRARAASRSAPSPTCSSTNARIVSKRLYRVAAEPWWATTSDLRTNESSSRSTSTSSSPRRRRTARAGRSRP